MRFEIIEIKPGLPHVYGATLAQENMRAVKRQTVSSNGVDTMLLLNFTGVLSVTPSYLKATVLSLIPPVGTNAAQSGENGKTSELPKLYPAICDCSADVAADIHEFLIGRATPILHITKRRRDSALAAKLFGYLDDVLLKTLLSLSNSGSATAAELARNSDENITVNGWNNRLADLHLLRLATRQRKGKFWIYSPVAERITTWA
jgi:hypothetical protein